MINPYYKQIKIFNNRVTELENEIIRIYNELVEYINLNKENYTFQNKIIENIYRTTIELVKYELSIVIQNRPRLKILNKEIEKCHTMN